jgi:hypothetical protein
VSVRVSTLDGASSVTREVEAHPGLNRWFWDLRWAPSAEEVAFFEERMAEARERFGGQIPPFFRNQRPRGREAGPGTYRIHVSTDGARDETTLTVRADPGVVGVLPSIR